MSKKREIELFVHCCNEKLAIRLDEKKVDYIVVGFKDFSCRFNNYFDTKSLKATKNKLKNSKLCVFLNNLYSENDLQELEKLLLFLEDINIDLVMFSDFAIPQIVYEKKLNLKLHYNPETLVTSYGQFPFYMENNIHKVNVATELTIKELEKLCANKNDMYVSTKGFGLGFIMHSRWPMISNFANYSELPQSFFNDIKYLLIKEDERILPNIIFEDSFGTHMLTGYYICSILQINILKQMKINALIIDSLFIHDDDLTLDFVVEKYLYVLENEIDDNELKFIYLEIEKRMELKISPGFFGEYNDVLHTLKVGDGNEEGN